MSQKKIKEIRGVNFEFNSSDKDRIERCIQIKNAIAFDRLFPKALNVHHTHWLVAEHPFIVDAELHRKLLNLGEAVYSFFDAIQIIYKEEKEFISYLLDIGVREDLLGKGLNDPLCNFRLDLMLENGEPKIAEMEEVYGFSGALCYLKDAYQLNYDQFFQCYNRLNFDYVFIDDLLIDYSDHSVLIDILNKNFNKNIKILPFSKFNPDMVGRAWRLCYVKDLIQYPKSHRKIITDSTVDFINPLFHSYGTKSVFTLPFVDKIKRLLINLMGIDKYNILIKGLPKSTLLTDKDKDLIDSLINNKKSKVLKVVDCPALEYTWGSRGVYFGNTNRGNAYWKRIVDHALKGEIPQNPMIKNTSYMVMDLIEGDRFDVTFLDEINHQISLMSKARIRLGPIYFRIAGHVTMPAGFATFVNTSMKVHTGSHAIIAPISFPEL